MIQRMTEVVIEKNYITAIQEAGDVLFDFIHEQRRNDVYRQDYKLCKPASLEHLRALKKAHSAYLKTMVSYTIYLEKVFEDHQFRTTNPIYANIITNNTHIGVENAFALFTQSNGGVCSDEAHPAFCLSKDILYRVDRGWIYDILDGIRIQHAELRKITHETKKLFGGPKFYQTIERFIRIRDLFISMHMTSEIIEYAIQKILSERLDQQLGVQDA